MSHSLTVHHTPEAHPDTSLPDTHQDTYSKTVLGFWMYLMTDCLLFACLFATYAVLRNNTFGGPSSAELFSLSTALIETLILLVSSVTCGLGVLSTIWQQPRQALAWLLLTFALGAFFIALEAREFNQLVDEGHSWTNSAFLSAFFTLVGTHGLHVTIGLLWLLVMLGQLLWQGVNTNTFRRLVIFSLFWHFLDVVWIFIFTFVYLIGVL